LHAKAIIVLLEVCWRTTHFQVDVDFLKQKDDMVMGSSISHTISNIYTGNFGKLALDLAQHKLLLWLHYFDTFVAWPHGRGRLQNFLSHLNSLRPSIQFTMETEPNNVIPFLDVLVIKIEITLAIIVYRKSAHTCRYLNFNSNHPSHV
jgi:hypothetical protein